MKTNLVEKTFVVALIVLCTALATMALVVLQMHDWSLMNVLNSEAGTHIVHHTHSEPVNY